MTDAIADVPAGYEVVIRSHGVPRTVYDELDARGITYHDATCPFVQKIQRIAAEAEKGGGQCCLWQATRPIRRCRGSWATPAERCSFLPIWPS